MVPFQRFNGVKSVSTREPRFFLFYVARKTGIKAKPSKNRDCTHHRQRETILVYSAERRETSSEGALGSYSLVNTKSPTETPISKTSFCSLENFLTAFPHRTVAKARFQSVRKLMLADTCRGKSLFYFAPPTV